MGSNQEQEQEHNQSTQPKPSNALVDAATSASSSVQSPPLTKGYLISKPGLLFKVGQNVRTSKITGKEEAECASASATPQIEEIVTTQLSRLSNAEKDDLRKVTMSLQG